MKKIVKALFLLFVTTGLTACSFNFFSSKIGTNSDTTINPDSSSDSSDNSSTTSEGDTISYPERLSISGPETVYIGQTVTYTTYFYPENVTYPEVSWFTTDSQIVSLQADGRVTGSQVGDVTLVASMRGPNNTSITESFDIHVEKAKINSFTLSETELALHPGETHKLSATYYPSYALQEYNWSSSNNDIAGVDATGFVTAKAEGDATISIKTVDSVEANCLVTVSKNTKMTVLVYMCGADLESTIDKKDGYLGTSYQGIASMDIDEILSVENQPYDVEIVLETGGAKYWAKSEIDPSKNQRWEIRDGNLIEKESFTRKNMGLTTTLQNFLEWGFTNYRAEHYGVVFWNHGGAMSGVCFDENFSNDGLTHDEIASAVSSARRNCNVTDKLDWVVYDACLMAVQDVVEYNSQNFNYMLASQESESGYGYDYDAWIPSLYQNPSISPAALLEEIGHTFMVEEQELYEYWHEDFDQTQSAFDLSKVQTYKTSFENFALKLDGFLEKKPAKVQDLREIIDSSKKYGETINISKPTLERIFPYDIFDIENALTKILEDEDFSFLENDIEAVLEKLDELVIYEEHGNATIGCGLNLFCPISLYQYNYACQGYRQGPETNFINWSKVTQKVFKSSFNV